MATKRDYAGMSDLEREVELEMDDELELDEEGGAGPQTYSEADEEADEEIDEEADEEADEEVEIDDNRESDEELFESVEEESADDQEVEIEADERVRDQEYVERLMEIATREYESDAEVEQVLSETLEGLANERLFGRLKRLGRRLGKSKVLRSLVKKGLSVASGQFPALKAALSLAKGDLKNAITNLGRQVVTGMIPGGGAALGALNALGFTQSDNPEENREAWENYVQLANEAFEHLADNVTPNADQPLEASRLATNAYRHALKRAQARTLQPSVQGGVRRVVRRHPGARIAVRPRGHVVRVDVKPGQVYVLRNVRKIIVRG
jgi:hypothetical protein